MSQNYRKVSALSAAVALSLWSAFLPDEPKKRFDPMDGQQSLAAEAHPLPQARIRLPDSLATKLFEVPVTSVGSKSLVSVQWDPLAPYAETMSELTIQAQLYGSRGLDYTRTSSGAWTSATARAIAANFSGFPTRPNGHAAGAAGGITVSPLPQVIPGGVNLVTIATHHRTAAIANSSEPFVARAGVDSQGGVAGIGVQSSSVCQPDTHPGALLNLAWNVHHLELQAKPTVAFAFVRDTVDVIQRVNDRTSIDRIGFVVYVENGRATRIPIDTTGGQSIAAWMQDNLLPTAAGVTGSGAFQVPVVVMDPCDPQQSTLLTIRNDHSEASYEVPPRAVPQTGSKLGSVPPDISQAGDNIHWDSGTQTLSFDPLPVNILTDGGRDQVSAAYRDDPLNGGVIAIGPALRFTQLDGRDYFAGDKLQIFDRNGELLLQASLPTLVYEDTLAKQQGFDLFGPILNFDYAVPGKSKWLDTFLDQLRIDSDLVAELFVDLLDAPLDWEASFDIPGRVILSYATYRFSVPEPPTLALLWLIWAVLGRQRRR